MGISSVGSVYQNHGVGVTTITGVNPTAVGDILILGVGYDSVSIEVSAVTHSGVSSWSQLVYGAGNNHSCEVWYGVVTSTGSATLTVTLSNSGVGTDLMCQQFTAGGVVTWAQDGPGGVTTSGSSSTVTYQSLVPVAVGDLYFGTFRVQSGTVTAGSTPGFVYTLNAGVSSGIAVSVACPGVAQQPTQPNSGPAAYTTAATLVRVVPAAGSYANFFPLLRGA